MKNKEINSKILIAPLNWGLGHATRCVPVIRALLKQHFEPVIAGDGDSLLFLKKTFPDLKSYSLPAYNIRYGKTAIGTKLKLLEQIPKIRKLVNEENRVVQKIVKKEALSGIISDNRFGVYSGAVPSVYITHQVNVLSGFTTLLTSGFHQRIISKFDACWVPDLPEPPGLAGVLSHSERTKLKINYIGPLSRFEKPEKTYKKQYDLMVLLSGPEPQRTLLEKKLLNELACYDKKVLFVRGVFSEKAVKTPAKHIEILNFLGGTELRDAILKSALVLSRPGYSTVMDLARLGSKAFFIPTPGQTEQEYLARHLHKQLIAPFSTQNNFKAALLNQLTGFTGFDPIKTALGSNRFPFEIFK